MPAQPASAQQPEPVTAPIPPFKPAPEFGAYAPEGYVPEGFVPADDDQQDDSRKEKPGNAQQQPMQPASPAPQTQQQPQGFFSNPFGRPEQHGAQQPQGFVPQGTPQQGTPQQGTPQSQAPQNYGNNSNSSKTRSESHWLSSIISAIIGAVVVAAVFWALLANGVITTNSNSSTPSDTSLSQSPSTGGQGTAITNGDNIDWQAVNKQVAAGVVSIQTEIQSQGQEGIAKGSGAILDTAGHVVTNNHVIEGAVDNSIQVTLNNGLTYPATVVGTDPTTDLAVLKITNAPDDLQPVTFADSSQLAVGQPIMAIGNPLGYENTATTGIVSALNRPVAVSDSSDPTADPNDLSNAVVTNAIQIDAAINPGNSGGPSFDAAGQVIGINSSIASASASSSSSEPGSIGIGFAIPSNLVKRISEEIMQNGKAQHAQLGVSIKDGQATNDGVIIDGVLVDSVTSDGPSEAAGIQKGDLITKFDGQSVSDTPSLLGFVHAAAVGDTAKVTVLRNGKSMDFSVKLAVATPADDNSDNQNQNQNGQDGQNYQNNPYSDNGNGSNGNGNGGTDGNGNGNNDYENGGGDGGFWDPFGLFGGLF
jgi:putative serine protease PepD